MATTHLTKKRLDAIIEALNARLAGELDTAIFVREDYEKALEWARLARERRKGDVNSQNTYYRY